MYIILYLIQKNMESYYLDNILADRVFWIYFIITLFFIIVGSSLIVTSNIPHMFTILIIWTISIFALMIIVYKASIKWGPSANNVCFVDYDAKCFEPSNRVWSFINIIFIILLILSVLWAGELSNLDTSTIKSMSGVLILLGGITLAALIDQGTFIITLLYLVIWFCLTFYVILTN